MSPTTSAALKASLPRKKILAERNDHSGPLSSVSHVLQTPHVDAETPPAGSDFGSRIGYSSRNANFSSRASELDEYQQNAFVPESSSQPYDPLTNYLSPRPKFLRYRPNKRLEKYIRRRNEPVKAKDEFGGNRYASFETQKPIEGEASIDAYASISSPSSTSSSREGSVKQEQGSNLSTEKLGPRPPSDEDNNGREERDENVNELEFEERYGHFNEVLKSLLLFGVVILSTLYISSMNSPTPPPLVQALQDFKVCYQKIQRHLLQVAAENFRLDSNFIYRKQENALGIIQPNERVSDVYNEKERIFEQGLQTRWEITGKKDGVSNQQGRQTRQVSDNESEEVGEISEPFPACEAQVMSSWVDQQNTAFSISGLSEEELNLEKDDLNAAELVSEMEKPKDVTNAEATGRDTHQGIGEEMVVENTMEEAKDIPGGMHGNVAPQCREHAIFNSPGIDEKSKHKHVKPVKVDSVFKFALLTSVGLVSTLLGVLHLKHRKTFPKDSASSGLMIVDNRSSPSPRTEEEKINKVDSYVSISPSVHSEGKASKEINQGSAPTVELLEEFVVEELSNSIKGCSMKSQRIEGEGSHFSMSQGRQIPSSKLGDLSSSLRSCGLKPQNVEGIESNFSVSQEKRSRRRIPSSPKQAFQTLSEFSATESPSFGSYTAQEVVVKKEEGRNGDEVMKIITTPVRRSSRIRNRAVMSP
ncbi:PREDICTED: uncharacterized protein LOC104592037 [Nelumbo nucifera]|uniref:Uncharacterized protein n=2 Tax=Nelumbo nucifera TaxID=4432 RepID=A0A822ZEF7_NELNU|nr:PREDICTED: uncharacterized protein LOC104592037 [Nelumbo nucifera]DAD44574.1 TPA_asm: hypothetical protein HUJ06_002804 [Nelumbo nucifera]